MVFIYLNNRLKWTENLDAKHFLIIDYSTHFLFLFQQIEQVKHFGIIDSFHIQKNETITIQKCILTVQ